jgi:hypothetical protein
MTLDQVPAGARVLVDAIEASWLSGAGEPLRMG